jgi:peroxiredoxin (alkyl hydroperoxide reductase subunit C)
MGGAEEGVECEDWFFCTKAISEEDIEKAIRAD